MKERVINSLQRSEKPDTKPYQTFTDAEEGVEVRVGIQV